MDPFDIYGEGLAAAREWQAEERAEHDAEHGNWLLREMAEESGGRLVEIAPGCFYESKLPGGGIESSSYGH